MRWIATTVGRGWKRRTGPSRRDWAQVRSADEAITYYYEHPTEPNMSGDEFVTPSIICDDGLTPRAVVKADDAILFYNYRGDRPRRDHQSLCLRRLHWL